MRNKFYMLIGPPASGKSTLVREMQIKYGYTVISSDAIRKQLYRDENIQGNPKEVFDVVRKDIVQATQDGKNVVYDATNMSRKNRRGILSNINTNTEKIAMIVWTSLFECYVRDKDRWRTVGGDVIDNMVGKFQYPYYDEGFDKIEWTTTKDLSDENGYVSDLHKDIWSVAKIIKQDNSHHSLTVGEHCYRVGKELAIKYPNDKELIIAGYNHDIGKIFTKSFCDYKGRETKKAHYYGHPGYSTWFYMPLIWSDRLANNYDCDKILWLISNHMEPYMNTKYYKNLPPELKAELDLLHEADENAK